MPLAYDTQVQHRPMEWNFLQYQSIIDYCIGLSWYRYYIYNSGQKAFLFYPANISESKM